MFDCFFATLTVFFVRNKYGGLKGHLVLVIKLFSFNLEMSEIKLNETKWINVENEYL